MKRLLLILILTLSFQSWAKADDIRDFEIEGMSIGDSLLDYFTQKEILKNNVSYYKDKKYTTFEMPLLSKSKSYDFIQVVYKAKDKQYKIYSLSGALDCQDNFKICEKSWEIVLQDLTKFFSNNTKIIDRGTYNQPADVSGKSKVSEIIFEFKSGDRATIEKTNWSKKIGYRDNLRVNVDTKEFVVWLNTDAYQ
mgnify:CR=1 FL=1